MIAVENEKNALSLLLEKGLISNDVIEATLSEQKLTGDRAIQILLDNGVVTRKQVISLIKDDLDPTLLTQPAESDAVPPEVLLKLKVMLLGVTEEKVYLATSSPKGFVKSMISQYFPFCEFIFLPYDAGTYSNHMRQLEIQVQNQDFLDGILREAVVKGVSDIHMVSKENAYILMYRLLGIRRIVRHISIENGLKILSQAKDKASIDIAERQRPKDGGFRAKVVDRNVDFRVATLPTINHENMVIRILDGENTTPMLSALGLSSDSVQRWKNAIQYTSGICLVCGPTGSGKSVTMNASIRELNRFEKSIYTVEDPVELRLAMLNQVGVNRSVGLDFSAALRAFMRMDPDVIVLGEIRDTETAELAIQAAETGHLVIGTIHADTPKTAIERLVSMGVDVSQVETHLRGLMSQKLVQALCPKCKGEGGELCTTCNGDRFTSRQAIGEAVCVRSKSEFNRIVKGEIWWETISQHGRELIKNKITSEEEVTRVLGAGYNQHSSDTEKECEKET